MQHTRKATESMATEVKRLSSLIQFTGEQHLQLQYRAELIMCRYVWRTDLALGKESVRCITHHIEAGFIFFFQLAVKHSVMKQKTAPETWNTGPHLEPRSLDAVNLYYAVKNILWQIANSHRALESNSVRYSYNNAHIIQTWAQMDTVKVAVFDPQEVWGAVADHGCHLSLVFPLHQHGHKVVNFIHVHVPHVVTAD